MQDRGLQCYTEESDAREGATVLHGEIRFKIGGYSATRRKVMQDRGLQCYTE